MKANKFPGNVMKGLGIKSWCQLGVIAMGVLIFLLMGLHGFNLNWDGPIPGSNFVEGVWNFISILFAFTIMMVGIVATAAFSCYGIWLGATKGWDWARNNCEQINYEEDDDV